MNPRIRDFTPADYPAVVAVSNAIYPDYPGTEEELRFEDESTPSHCILRRWVAEHDGRIVGSASASQSPSQYHPQKFYLEPMVLPEWQGRGIGKRLYDHLVDELQLHRPLAFRAGAREDMTRKVRFLADRGFREVQREWESRLDVVAFDPAPHAGAENRPCAHGVEIGTLADSAGDPDRDEKLRELNWVLEEDVPHTKPATRVTLEHFRESHLGNPNLLPEGYFIAVHGNDYVGLSALWASQGNTDLYTGLTGVRREYRRQGIALAMKLRAIDYAKRRGNPVVKTWNEVGNRAMLSINGRLGFVRQPAWIEYLNEAPLGCASGRG